MWSNLFVKGKVFKLMRREDNVLSDALESEGWQWIGEFDEEATLLDRDVKSSIGKYRSGEKCDHCGWVQGAHACPGLRE